MSDQLTPWIKVEGGDLFEGTLEQWEDCFFAFPESFSTEDKLSQIESFATGSDFSFEVTWKNKDGLTVRKDLPRVCACCH